LHHSGPRAGRQPFVEPYIKKEIVPEALAPVRDQINVLSGLAHRQADTFGDGTGDHPRASAVWLTGVHAFDRTQPGVEVRLATTADQLAWLAESGLAATVTWAERDLVVLRADKPSSATR